MANNKAAMMPFTHIILDEAGQCLEVDTLIPFRIATSKTRIIMAGDPAQQAPPVFSKIGLFSLEANMESIIVGCRSIQCQKRSDVCTMVKLLHVVVLHEVEYCYNYFENWVFLSFDQLSYFRHINSEPSSLIHLPNICSS